MKKKNVAAFALLAVMLLTACGRGAADAAVTTEEIVVPEISSGDMLVNSLEYLLEDETKEAAGGEEIQEKEQETEADRKTTDGNDAQTAVICYGKDMESGLMQEEITAQEITPDVLLSALARHNIVPLFDTKALSMEEREEDGRRLLYLDLSGSFREYLLTMSMEAECIIISSIVNTFMVNYDADAVYITVKGETLVTSHAEYTEAVAGDTPGDLMAHLAALTDGEKGDAGKTEEE